ncbi:MAG: nickel pincer cofactor biosynthesis protein LarB [Proteobacteria bacterium]|nr:nickel pincer cofactor biosynthesis protein LarB [Pseudomonadota bacterium]
MNEQLLTTLLQQVGSGEVKVAEALQRLRHWPVEVLESARIDHHRLLRTSQPEVVFGATKTPTQLIEILGAMLASSTVVLATRVAPEKAELIRQQLPQLTFHPTARILTGNDQYIPAGSGQGTVVIVTAGTSDLAVAEEARITLQWFGHEVATLCDVGVAGIHRILAHVDLLQQARVVIVAAGMEGALPSVVAGLTASPVIGVPTSIGYGAGAGGYAALLGMLNSCSPGLAVVNIDNGFGAACMAAAINRAN